MFKDISVFLILLFLIGCSINVEDSTRTIESTVNAAGVNGIKISSNEIANGDINVTGDELIDSMIVSAEINQMVLQNEAPADVDIYLKDINNGNKKIAFRTYDSDWQGITIGDISAKLPSHIALDISSEMGDINVSGMKNSVFAYASSGDVDIETEGAVEVEVSSGDVDIITNGKCDIEASSGNVTAISPEFINIESSSGDVNVRTQKGCNIDVSSGEVDIIVQESDSIIFNKIEIESSSGDVEILLPDGFSAWLDLEATSGDISLKNSDVGDDYSAPINGGSVGERVIKVRCTSGDIKIIGF